MFRQIFNNMPGVVKNLLIINLLFFVAKIMFESKGTDLGMMLGMHYPGSKFFEPYQIVTYMFMHGNFMHILFNMFALVMFGAQLERVWGPKKFLIYYLATGIGALLLHILVTYLHIQNIVSELDTSVASEYLSLIASGTDSAPVNMDMSILKQLYIVYNTPMVGASGAIFGILLGFAMYFPNTELMLLFPPIPIKAKYLIGGYILLELYLGYANNPQDNVAHFAHLGGALIGFIFVKIWKKDRNNFY